MRGWGVGGGVFVFFLAIAETHTQHAIFKRHVVLKTLNMK